MSVTVTQQLTQQTVTVTGNPVENNVTVTVSNARGPAGPNVVNASTTSDGTANLSLAAATVSGTLTAPTAATTTSTTQVATTAFVQQEIASGVAVAKNLEFLAHNGSVATIAKGSIVYINGAVSGVPRITKSQANNDTNSARTIGFVKDDIANGSNGFVIIEGELLNVSTADLSGIIGAGNQLYLSPTTPGAFTRTKPSAPNHLVYVGVVITASTGVALDGKILVGIQNGYELDEIHDVSITAPVAAKQVIKRNAGNTLWINSAIASADVSDATDAATANTLVLRDANGNASFGQIFSFTLTVTGGTTFGEESLIQFDAVEYYYGTGAASAHRIALGAGTTGATLFGAADAGAARTTLGLATADSPTFAGITTAAYRFSNTTQTPGIVHNGLTGNSGRIDIIPLSNSSGAMASVGNFWIASASFNFTDGHSSATPLLITLIADASGTLAQRNGTNAQTSRIYDTYASTTDYHRLAIATARATATAMSGASVTLTNIIPAGAVVVGVTCKVKTAITGATSFDLGTAADPDRFGAAIATTLGITSDNRDWTSGTVECFPSATSLVLTANGSNFTGGAVYVSVQYLSGQAD